MNITYMSATRCMSHDLHMTGFAGGNVTSVGSIDVSLEEEPDPLDEEDNELNQFSNLYGSLQYLTPYLSGQTSNDGKKAGGKKSEFLQQSSQDEAYTLFTKLINCMQVHMYTRACVLVCTGAPL